MQQKGTATGFATLLNAAVAAGLSPRPADSPSLTGKAERDEIELVADNDRLMAAAMRKARATLPHFLALADNPRRGMTGFSVKVAIRQGCEAEYFWIHPFGHKDGVFTGRLGNTPQSVTHVKKGDRLAFTQHEIVDWMYMDGETMRGNFTARAMLMRATPQERDDFKRRFGLDSEF